MTYPRREVAGRSEAAAEHGEAECSKEEKNGQEEDIGHIVRVTSVAIEQPVPRPTVGRQQALSADKHLNKRLFRSRRQMTSVPVL